MLCKQNKNEEISCVFYVVSIDFWQYKVEDEVKTMRNLNIVIIYTCILLVNIISTILVWLLTNTSENDGHVRSSVIYCEFYANISFFVEIESKRTDLDVD